MIESPAPVNDLISEVQAAKILHLSRGFLAKDRETGRHGIPYFKMARRVLYREADIRAWMAGCYRPHGSAAA